MNCYQNHLKSGDDLITGYESTRAGFDPFLTCPLVSFEANL